jgi:RNA polymerase sigma-70 factor (ECF subfamily)
MPAVSRGCAAARLQIATFELAPERPFPQTSEMAKSTVPTELLPTRTSLLKRLKDETDNKSWQEFFDMYSGFIYRFALKSGLNDAEAKDVVQETFISVAKHIKAFEYDNSKSFKSWLLTGTRWRISAQFRKRLPVGKSSSREAGETKRTSTIEKVPNDSEHGFDAKWDRDWREHIGKIAMQRVRNQVNAKDYQIYDAYVIKEWPVQKVEEKLDVSEFQVYKAKSRIAKILKVEVLRLEKAGI